MWQSHPHPGDFQALHNAMYALDDEYKCLLATNAIAYHAHHTALAAGTGREEAAKAVAVRLADQLETRSSPAIPNTELGGATGGLDGDTTQDIKDEL